jgi:hypothetical protein
MGFDMMMPSYNFEYKYRIKMLNREDLTKGTGTLPAVKGFSGYRWVQDAGGTGAGIYGKSIRRRLSFLL